MDEEETCNTGLILGIGCGDFDGGKQKLVPQKKLPVQFHLLFPPLSNAVDEEEVEKSKSKETDDGEDCIRNGNDNSKSSTRKKLRLTKEQSGFLEDSFKEHNTLTPTEKQELAKRLNLRPRQVEVWFQNRRARTKLKQMEVDCELLKKCCEGLSTENRRLKKELQELKTMKVSPPFYIQLPKAAASALTMCPSCNKGGMSDVKMEKKEVFDAMKGASTTY